MKGCLEELTNHTETGRCTDTSEGKAEGNDGAKGTVSSLGLEQHVVQCG